jgi:hypothetical protein
MAFGNLVHAAFQGPTGIAITGVAILGILELVTGALRAFAAKQFKIELVDTWVRTDLAGRILPITVVLIAGAAAPDLSALGVQVDILTATGLAGAAVYAASTLASIVANVNPAAADSPPTE